MRIPARSLWFWGLTAALLISLPLPASAQRGGGGGGEGGGSSRGGDGGGRSIPAQPRSHLNMTRDPSGGVMRERPATIPAGPEGRPTQPDRGESYRPDNDDRDHGGGEHGNDRPPRPTPEPKSWGERRNELQHNSLYRDYRDTPQWQRDNAYKYPAWDRDGDGRPDRPHHRRPEWQDRPWRDWRDIDWRHIDNDDYRRWIYFQSFYRYYPLPLWDDDWFMVPTEGGSSASYSTTTDRITEIDTAEGEKDKGEWVEGREVELPQEEEIEGETVEIYHPAVYRQTANGKLELLEEASVTREPKVRIVLRKQWVPGHYANEAPDMSQPRPAEDVEVK